MLNQFHVLDATPAMARRQLDGTLHPTVDFHTADDGSGSLATAWCHNAGTNKSLARLEDREVGLAFRLMAGASPSPKASKVQWFSTSALQCSWSANAGAMDAATDRLQFVLR